VGQPVVSDRQKAGVAEDHLVVVCGSRIAVIGSTDVQGQEPLHLRELLEKFTRSGSRAFASQTGRQSGPSSQEKQSRA